VFTVSLYSNVIKALSFLTIMLLTDLTLITTATHACRRGIGGGDPRLRCNRVTVKHGLGCLKKAVDMTVTAL
jgi:hypothetical protein